jgi:NodT family efflux transporter outer membrane factor (OMF) lipoprotein
MAAAPLVGVLAACAVGPDYKPPDEVVPARYAGTSGAGTAGSVATGAALTDVALARWWTGFDDPTLDDLVARALRDNLDMQAAASRIREARQQEIVAGAAGWPSLSANAQFTHSHLSQNSLGSLGGLFGGASAGGAGRASGSAASAGAGSPSAFGLPGFDFNTFQLGFDASWELDLFGRTRRSVEAAHDTMTANVWNSRDTKVSLVAEVADTYLALRAAQRRLAINQRDLARQQDLLDQIRTRTAFGLATGLDVRQQETAVAATSSALPPLSAEVDVRLHALGVLLGEPPEALLDTLGTAAPPTPPSIPAGLPADLLRRRPDIRAAERQLAAATANIGVAVADYYPDITLTASPALVSTALSNLLTWGSRNLSAGPGLSWNLFDGGKVKANVAIANEHQRQALLTYRKTVLTALQDVEDALTRSEADRTRQQDLARQTDSARAAADLSRGQYRAGLIPFSTVLTTEAALLSAQDTATQNAATTAQDVVALYKALGGGWDDTDPMLALAP